MTSLLRYPKGFRIAKNFSFFGCRVNHSCFKTVKDSCILTIDKIGDRKGQVDFWENQPKAEVARTFWQDPFAELRDRVPNGIHGML